MRDLRELERYRNRAAALAFYGGLTDPGMDKWHGFFLVPVKGSKRPLRVLANSGEMPGSHGWDHVSVSLPGRCPNWGEMDQVKRLFFRPDEVAMQLHPQESEHISNHPYCLHIWRPVAADIPLPPSLLVGIGSLGELDGHNSRAFIDGLRAAGVM